MKKSFPHWKGFEFPPQGCLLEQVVDMSGEMGIAYERSCDFYKHPHTHDRLMLVFSRGSSVMRIRGKNPNCSFKIDRSSVLIVPEALEHDDLGLSAIYDTLALFPSMKLLEKATQNQDLTPRKFRDWTSRYQKLARSAWLDQLVQQYFSERVILKSQDLPTLQFFELQIIKETIRIAFHQKASVLPVIESSKDITQKAIRDIESNLFDRINLKSLAKACGTSESTLLRNFKRDLDMTPFAYIKKRRMEEARSLLQSSKYNVSQVAILVGYENFGAFTDAFKSVFGQPPSRFLK